MSIEKVDLYKIYRSVKQRERNLANKSESTAIKIEHMVKTADDIIKKAELKKATLKDVAVFRKAELDWFNSYDVKNGVVLFADEFENAIRSKSFEIIKPYFKNLHCGYNPDLGTIYCLVSSSKPKQVKIGFTTMSLKVRIQKLQKKYDYENSEVIFFQQVANPAEVEQHAHKLLRDKRVSAVTNNDSNEWFEVGHRGAINAVKKAIQLVG